MISDLLCLKADVSAPRIKLILWDFVIRELPPPKEAKGAHTV